MTNNQRDLLMLQVLKRLALQDVWIKWTYGVVCAGLMTTDAGEKLSATIRREQMEIEAEFAMLEDAATGNTPTTIN
jgi:hypothetical protein